MINPGKFNKKIEIKKVVKAEDTQGFIKESEVVVLSTYAQVKTTSGYTLLINNTDFEKATTNFTIRKPKATITRSSSDTATTGCFPRNGSSGHPLHLASASDTDISATQTTPATVSRSTTKHGSL